MLKPAKQLAHSAKGALPMKSFLTSPALSNNSPAPEINFLVKFLWFCAGANTSVLKKCQVDHDKYAAIGFIILLTAILASVSGGYALWTVFNSQAMATLLGGFWGLMIGSLDRFLVSTTRKEDHWSFQQTAFITIRVIVAIFIALVVAKPLEIKIFEKPIRAKLVEENSLQRSADQQRLIKAYSEIKDKEKANQALEKELDRLKQQRDQKSQEVICEIDGTCGTTKVGHGPAFREKQKDLNVISQEYEKKKQDSEKQINENRQRIAELTKKRDFELAKIDNEREKADDIMTQLEILDKLANKKAIFITLLFVLIDVSPILAKMLLKRSLYDIALEKEEETQLNIYLRSLSVNENYSLQQLEITEEVQQRAITNVIQSDDFKQLINQLSQVYTNKLSREISQLGEEFNPSNYKHKIKQEMDKQAKSQTIPTMVEEELRHRRTVNKVEKAHQDSLETMEDYVTNYTTNGRPNHPINNDDPWQ
jgi:hypothetical protein